MILIKRVISTFLAIILIISSVLSVNFIATANDGSDTDFDANISTQSNNGLVDLFADEIEESQNELQQDKVDSLGSISRMTFSEKTATVNFSTSVYANLVVGVFPENEDELIAVGTVSVNPDNNLVDVEIDIDVMPQFYIAKGFLIDATTFKPICETFVCNYYTSDMQELFDSDISDYDDSKVVNFDESNNNNFAVYNDSVVIQNQTETDNILASDNDGVYVIDHANNAIKSLKKGDILSLNFEDENLIVIKIDSVTVDGDRVILVEDEDVELDEVFECVKITTSDDLYEIDSSNDNVSPEDPSETEGSDEIEKHSGSFTNSQDELSGEDKKKQVKTTKSSSASAEATLTATLTAGADIFVTKKSQSITVYIAYSLDFTFVVKAKASLKVTLPTFEFPIFWGFTISATPSITLTFNALVNLSVTYAGSVGIMLDGKGGFNDISEKPKPYGNLDINGSVSLTFALKISLNAPLGLVSGYISPRFTVTLTAKLDNKNPTHSCSVCFKGELILSVGMDYGIEFLKGKKSFPGKGIEFTNKKLSDYYYSATFNEFALTTCPHSNGSKVRTLNCHTASGSPARYAVVTLYRKSCSCDLSGMNLWTHRFAFLNHYTKVKDLYCDVNGKVSFELGATEDGYDYAINARYGGMSSTYYFPWGGGPVYPIEIAKSSSSSAENIVEFSDDDELLATSKQFAGYEINGFEENDGIRTVKYENLTPNEVYNFYSARNISGVFLLDKSNLLYINQYVADENGDITVTYKPNSGTDEYEECIFALGADDINIADVTNDETLSCKTGENRINPSVTVYDRVLTENVDYVLEDECETTIEGSHTYSIVGIGNYKGSILRNYTATLYKTEFDSACEKANNLVDKACYTEESRLSLKNCVISSSHVVDNTNDQTVVDSMTNNVKNSIEEIQLINSFCEEYETDFSWSWDKDTKTITVIGTGRMPSLNPWEEYKDIVENVVISPGITSCVPSLLAKNPNFSNCPNLTKVTIPASVNIIRNTFFENSNNVTVYGYNDTYAQRFCNSNEIPFVVINDSHDHMWTEYSYNNDAVYTSSTSYKDGTATKECLVCGLTDTKSIPGTGLLRINTASISLNSAVTLSVNIDKSRETPFADTYCVMEYKGNEYKITSDKKFENITTRSRWQYDFDKIAPQYFADDVTITMYGVTEDGIVCKGHSVNYSVLKYCNTQLSKSSSSNNLKNLIIEILYYGEADRIYRNNTTSSSPIAGLSAADMARHTTDVPTYVNAQNATFATVDNPTLVWKAISLDIIGAVRPMFRFEIPVGDNLDDYTFDIDVDGLVSTMSSVTDPDAFVAYTGTTTSGAKSYYIYVDKVKAYQFNLPFTIVANKNGATVSNTVQYSVESYATKSAYKDGTTELKNLVDQMLRYGRTNAIWSVDKYN